MDFKTFLKRVGPYVPDGAKKILLVSADDNRYAAAYFVGTPTRVFRYQVGITEKPFRSDEEMALGLENLAQAGYVINKGFTEKLESVGIEKDPLDMRGVSIDAVFLMSALYKPDLQYPERPCHTNVFDACGRIANVRFSQKKGRVFAVKSIDWFTGFEYEYATPKQVIDLMQRLGTAHPRYIHSHTITRNLIVDIKTGSVWRMYSEPNGCFSSKYGMSHEFASPRTMPHGLGKMEVGGY